MNLYSTTTYECIGNYCEDACKIMLERFPDQFFILEDTTNYETVESMAVMGIDISVGGTD